MLMDCLFKQIIFFSNIYDCMFKSSTEYFRNIGKKKEKEKESERKKKKKNEKRTPISTDMYQILLA